jgi:hypothetical protein
MTLIADIIHDITANPAPVLFLDSCILLDVVRAPLRDKPDEVRFAQLFLTSVQKSPKTIHLLVASPTEREWTDHIAETENDCTIAMNGCNAVASICGHMGLPPVAFLPPAVVLNLSTLLRNLSRDLLAEAVSMDHDFAALGRAVDRINASTRPAKPGGKGAKDSVILEHAVEATAQLRNAGFAGTCLFVSSNTKDFADAGSINLHAQLTPVLKAVNLEYAVSLTHAESILKAAGWVP